MDIVQLVDETLRPNQFTVNDLEIEILPLIYEIIRRFVVRTLLISIYKVR